MPDTKIDPHTQYLINSWAAEVLAFLGKIRNQNDEANDLYNHVPSALFAIRDNDIAELERIQQLFEKYAR